VNDTAKYELMRRLYDGLPKLQCQRRCQACCGRITMTRLELAALTRVDPAIRTRRIKAVTEGGHQVGMVHMLKVPEDGPRCGTCPLLKDGACSAYEHRPLICRIWGVTIPMTCPHGCRPERYLTEREAFQFLRAAVIIGF
jgi:Fe-S-cluster containining protein